MVILFDEIGFSETVPVPGSQGRLTCRVQSIGATKALVIGPDPNSTMRELSYSTELIGKQLLCLREITDGLQVFFSTFYMLGLYCVRLIVCTCMSLNACSLIV